MSIQRPVISENVQRVAQNDVENALLSRLLFLDDFDKSIVTTLPWFMTVTTTGAAITLDSTAGLWTSGGQAMKFASGTQNGLASEIHRYHGKLFGTNAYVFGGRLALDDGTNPANIGLYLGYRDGTNWTRGKLLYVQSTKTWSWTDSTGANNTLLTAYDMQPSPTRSRWHTFRIVVDFATSTYITVRIDNYDFSGIVGGQALRSAADATVPNQIDCAIDATDTAVAGAFRFDQVFCGAY